MLHRSQADLSRFDRCCISFVNAESICSLEGAGLVGPFRSAAEAALPKIVARALVALHDGLDDFRRQETRHPPIEW